MVILAVCNLSVIAVSIVVRVKPKYSQFSTVRLSRMDMVTTWVRMEALKVKLVVTAS